jgi:YidC/Oxa1 family membrane protein insertase
MNQDNNNFMDSRTLWAILLVGVVWFGWQNYINKKYGQQSQQTSAPVNEQVPTTAAANLGVANNAVVAVGGVEEKIAENPERRIDYSNANFRAQISSKGMALKTLVLNQFTGRDKNPVTFSGGEFGLFSTQLSGRPVEFQISQEGAETFVGVAEVGGLKIHKKLVFSDNYKVSIETKLDSTEGAIPPVELSIEDDLKKVEAGSIFSPPLESQEILILNNEGEKDFNMASEPEGISATINQANLASINSHYFSAAFLDKSDLLPSFIVDQKPSAPFLKGQLKYSFSADTKSMVLKGIGYVGPKDINVLESVDPKFLKLVKFGFFSAIAQPLLLTMKWLNSFIGNWGWSIILLTLLVRMIVMPLHIMSFRSMKAMQKVQPLIQNLRDKYKDDPMTLNREMMELMKRHKVNPLGGCLPMLLQIPVFFALYRVFSESIELYQSPFIFWIHDLSSKDPFFVLPIFMAAVMYLQQKMTPSTMDPAQARVMQFMPIIFSLMMISLPSALTLYMFVSTFFGILQQYLFLRDKPATAVAIK